MEEKWLKWIKMSKNRKERNGIRRQRTKKIVQFSFWLGINMKKGKISKSHETWIKM